MTDESVCTVVGTRHVARSAGVFGMGVAGGDFADGAGEEDFVFCFVDLVDHEFDDCGFIVREVDSSFFISCIW